MSARDTGGPAFPNNLPGFSHDGMTLRDWFAGKALQGAWANGVNWTSEDFARNCYAQADAMLAERAK